MKAPHPSVALLAAWSAFWLASCWKALAEESLPVSTVAAITGLIAIPVVAAGWLGWRLGVGDRGEG